MSGHTKGRLGRNIPPITRYPTLYAGRNSHVCVMTTRGIPAEVAEANADRIVACWNACEGMDDPAAEVARLREEGRAFSAACMAAQAERDEALTQLEGLYDWAEGQGDGAESLPIFIETLAILRKAGRLK